MEYECPPIIVQVGFTEWRWSGVSLLVLLPLPLIQAIIYQAGLTSYLTEFKSGPIAFV